MKGWPWMQMNMPITQQTASCAKSAATLAAHHHSKQARQSPSRQPAVLHKLQRQGWLFFIQSMPITHQACSSATGQGRGGGGEGRDGRSRESPVHDPCCMGTHVMAIRGEPPARVKQVDGGSEVTVARVRSHDAKLIPKDVCYGHICHMRSKVLQSKQTCRFSDTNVFSWLG